MLDNLVFQGGYADGALSPVGFGYPGPFARLSPIPAAVNLIMEYDETFIYAFAILLPRHVVDSGRRLWIKRQVGRVQSFIGDVVQQIGET